jgi:spermidine/putrescine transport system permease protein
VKRSWFASPYALWCVMFTVVPLMMIGYYAFTDSAGAFTLANFQRFFRPTILGVLRQSLWMAFLCTVICLVIAYPAALFLTSKDFSKHKALVVLVILPMWMNFLLRTYAWLTLLEDTGLINRGLQALGLPRLSLLYNDGAVLMGMVYNFLPFMVLPIYTVLSKMDQRVIEAAEDLGANWFHVLTRVVFPLSLPGVMSGITMVFMPSVTTFVIPKLLGGGSNMLFGDLIEQQFMTTGNWNFGSALSLLMMLLILISIGFLNRLDPKHEGGAIW